MFVAHCAVIGIDAKGNRSSSFHSSRSCSYFLFAGILSFGQLFYGAQSLQSAADTAAREIARLPLPPTTSPFASSSANGISLYDVLYNPAYSSATAGSICAGAAARCSISNT